MPTLFTAEPGFGIEILEVSSFGMLGALSFGVGTRLRIPLRFLRADSATPPASPTRAAPPASAGPLALPAIVSSVDLLPLRDCWDRRV